MDVVYEDNHLIIVDKSSSEIVQGDKTGDKPLAEMVKEYIKQKYHKPGNVFLGVVHRLDRPVSGLVVFARTGKALAGSTKCSVRKKCTRRIGPLWGIVRLQKKGNWCIGWCVTRSRTSRMLTTRKSPGRRKPSSTISLSDVRNVISFWK